jgi:uncharacterized membrane protein (UPF0127 family)
MKKNFCLLFILFSLLISSSCSNQKKLPSKELTIVRADGSQVALSAEIARTPEQRNHGFMERKNIPDGTGMIFIFEKDQILSFWMKNTPHPLSIAYIDSTGKIRELHDMKPFCLDPVTSQVYCRYALEVPQGWFAKNNIKPGDMLDVSVLK